MKKKALILGKKFLQHQLVSGSLYIFLGSILANFLNFIFNLFMSRNLTVEDYGILASVSTLVGLSTIPIGSIIPTVVNFAGQHFAKENYGLVRSFFAKIIKPLFLLSIILLICFILFAKYIGDFFHIFDQTLIIITGFTVLISYLGVVNIGLLQAKLAFRYISFLNLISSLIKLSFGMLLVFFGFNIRGVAWSIFLSGLIPFILSFIPLRVIFKSHNYSSHSVNLKKLLSYGVPSSIATLCLTSLISTDILLVKHFFDPLQAGIYAGLSLVGKVIFFFSAPISTVMFPLLIQKHARKENYNNIFKMALILVLVPSSFFSLVYFLYPKQVITFFIKKDVYQKASNLLGLFGIFITLYSLIFLFVYYFLSIKKTKVFIPVTITALAQIFLICLYHDSLIRVVLISIIMSSLLLIFLFLYYIQVYNRSKNLPKPLISINSPV